MGGVVGDVGESHFVGQLDAVLGQSRANVIQVDVYRIPCCFADQEALHCDAFHHLTQGLQTIAGSIEVYYGDREAVDVPAFSTVPVKPLENQVVDDVVQPVFADVVVVLLRGHGEGYLVLQGQVILDHREQHLAVDHTGCPGPLEKVSVLSFGFHFR